MATWRALSTIARGLPGVVEGRSKEDRVGYSVEKKSIAWERPLRKSDLAALGDSAPKGDILAVYVPDLETKDLLVNGRSDVYFTTPHFDGYAIVLVRLEKIPVAELRDLLKEAWRCRAPARLVREHEAGAPKKRTRAPKKTTSRRRG